MKRKLLLSSLLVSSLIFSQSNYPLQTIINGDSVVILRKGQADTINDIFESQKQKIADARQLIEYKDSLLRRKDSLLRITNITVVEYDLLYSEYINTLMFLDYIESWVYDRAKEGAWLYYSQDSLWVEAVDLSPYALYKNDETGDLFFYRKATAVDDKENKNKNAPKRGWDKEIILTNRPKIQKL